MDAPATYHNSFEVVVHPLAAKALIIIVPGVGTSPVREWTDDDRYPWPQSLPEDVVPSPAIFTFRHGLDLYNQENSVWARLMASGHDLLVALDQTLARNENCISEALRRRSDDQNLARRISIFVAIAVPHSRSRDEGEWDFAQNLVRAQRHSSYGKATTPVDADNLSRLCKDFEKVATNANLYVLAVYEDKAVPVKSLLRRLLAIFRALWRPSLSSSSPKSVVIVPRNSCEIRIPGHEERSFQVHASHFDICRQVPRGMFYCRLAVDFTLCTKHIAEEQAQDVPPSCTEESPIKWTDSVPILDRPGELAGSVNKLLVVPSSAGSDVAHTLDTSTKIGSATAQTTMQTSQEPAAGPSEATESSVSHDGATGVSESHEQTAPEIPTYTTTKRDPRLPCRLVPGTAHPEFIGRSQLLDEIDSSLHAVDYEEHTDTGVRSFAICGPGGMGKTQLATEYVAKYENKYDAIFWVDASRTSTLAEQFSRIAVKLGLVLEGSPDARDHYLAREHVKGWLAKPVRSYNKSDTASPQEVPWLVVFDNVEQPQALLDYWPTGSSNGSILVTSRNHAAATPGLYPVTKGTVLGPLQVDDAANLLLRLTWREEDPHEETLSKELAARLGGLPQALVRMAAISNADQISFAEVLRQYGPVVKKDEILSKLQLDSEHDLDATYRETLASIGRFESLRFSSALLDVMTFFDPAGIPENLLKGAVGWSSLDDYPKTPREYHEACAELHRYSLIAEDGSHLNLTVHHTTQDSRRAKLFDSPVRASAVFKAAVDIIWEQWPKPEPGFRHIIDRWDSCAVLAPHAEQIKEQFQQANLALQLEWRGIYDFAALLNEVGWYFQERGRVDDALNCFNIAQKNAAYIAAECKTGAVRIPQHDPQAQQLLAETHGNVAGAALDMNNAKKAQFHFKKYNKMLVREHLGMEVIPDARLTSSFYDVGLSLTMDGNHLEAVRYLKEAIREAGRLQGESRVKAARSLALINLGLAYWLMDWQNQAQEQLLRALKEREEILGPNDRQSMITGRALHCLGNVRQSLGDYNESFLYHQRALVHFTDTVGELHHRTGNSCFKVAEHFFRQKKYSQALLGRFSKAGPSIAARKDAFLSFKVRYSSVWAPPKEPSKLLKEPLHYTISWTVL
ncbi:Coatomer subunit beta' [Elsinoe australis]|uniref:Coatomer subunit beta n=1 Tax=Elsinoe australis TaxID=40998 RepID=A0A2P7ZDZ3_9PEZI|nr:Coatomer subunit beta' [Elsinoe australis]